MFNITGEVVGLNTAIFSPPGGNVSIGFAVPATFIRRLVEDLRDYAKVERGWLGVSLQPVDRDLAAALGTSEPRRALVSVVEPGSPAARGGLQTGDVVTQAGDRHVQVPRDLTAAVAEARPGTSLPRAVFRSGQGQQQPVTLVATPDRAAVLPPARKLAR